MYYLLGIERYNVNARLVTDTDRQTDTQINPCCTCMPRVNKHDFQVTRQEYQLTNYIYMCRCEDKGLNVY